MLELIKSIPHEYWLYASIGILVLGIILGFTKTIIVYRDYADLTKVFMLVLAPVGIFYLLGDKVDEKIIRNIFIGFEAIILLWIIVTTFIDNRNIFKTILALITKIPLGIIFAIYLINLLSPGGKTRSQRQQGKGIAALILLILGPILYGLVKSKTWSSK